QVRWSKPETHWLESGVTRCYNCGIPQDKAPVCARCVRGRRPGPAGEYAMRATSMVVAFSSLLVASSVSAGPTPADKTPKAPATSKAGDKAGAGKGTTPAPTTDASAPAPPAATPAPSEPPPDLAAVKPEDMPTSVRMRRLEQKTQALKERAWQL